MDEDEGVVIVGDEVDAGLRQALLLVDVSPGRGHEGQQVDGADGGQQPVEFVEAALVEVVGEPGPPPACG